VRRVSVPSSKVALIGAGASALVLDLVQRGYRSIEAVDVSSAALHQLRERLGHAERAVHFVRADVLDVVFDGQVDVWHDRATFHFLVDPDDQARYASRATAAVRPGGHLIIATFAANGPEQCSGLPVARHSAAALGVRFAEGFDQIEAFGHDHVTPWGAVQPFTYAIFRRRQVSAEDLTSRG
jgi:SAM-dependent methyltransferase